MIACENAGGCVCLGKLGLVVPLATVGRSLFESVISTFWASLTDNNTRHAIESESAELMRIMKRNLRSSRAQIVHEETGAIETQSVLDHPTLAAVKMGEQYG